MATVGNMEIRFGAYEMKVREMYLPEQRGHAAYGHLLEERYRRAKLALRSANAVTLEKLCSESMPRQERRVWNHAFDVRMRVYGNLMRRGGRPQPGAPR